MGDIQAILDKVRKLRALARSDNANEAAAAAAAAERILADHELTEAELETSGAGQPAERPTLDAEPVALFSQRGGIWRKMLAIRLATMHGCIGYLQYRRDEQRNLTIGYRMVGRPSDVATVRYLYSWLSLEIDRLAALHTPGNGRSYAHSYRLGAVSGVCGAMEEARETAKASAGVSSAAIVLVDSRLKESASELARQVPNLRSGGTYRPSAHSRDGYERGKRDGRNIHTGARLGNGSSTRLLGS